MTTIVEQLERCFFAAWPALNTCFDGPAVIRLSRGYTKRANSVSFLDPDDSDLYLRMIRAEDMYLRHHLPPCFRLTPLAPPGLDAMLEERGYRRIDETLTMTMTMTTALSPVPPDMAMYVRYKPNDAWLRAFIIATGTPAEHEDTMRTMLSRIVPSASYLTLRTEDGDVGTTLVVTDGTWAGIFDVAVREDLRGKGYGARLMRGVLAHAAASGATHAWLQVMETNTSARHIYDALGFTEAYRYFYRIRAA